MRPVAALLLGGMLCCGDGFGAASAESTGTAPGIESPSLLFAAGVFALVEAYDYPYSVGMTYVARPMTSWRLSPGTGFAVGPDGIAFMYVDVRRDFALGERWYVTPSLATGWFINGDEIGPRDHLEFQTGIQFARRFDNGIRLGLAGMHISNGGLEHPNNGTEAVLLTLQLPLPK
jgi:hypothetical protein